MLVVYFLACFFYPFSIWEQGDALLKNQVYVCVVVALFLARFVLRRGIFTNIRKERKGYALFSKIKCAKVCRVLYTVWHNTVHNVSCKRNMLSVLGFGIKCCRVLTLL